MRIEIKENCDRQETTVEILCKAIDEDILKLERHVKLFSKTIVARSAGIFNQIPAAEIYYIEAVERKTFVYTKDSVYETDFRLYELEERLADCDFIRASKSMILNLQKVSILTPEINRMIAATMKNGETIYISRQQARQLKMILSGVSKGGRTKQ